MKNVGQGMVFNNVLGRRLGNKLCEAVVVGGNRPFPSSCLPSLESESKCKVFVMVISSTLHLNEN